MAYFLEHEFQKKKSQGQNSIQHFEFSVLAVEQKGPGGQRPTGVKKKCGKLQNVVSSSDLMIFSPEMHMH